MSQYVKVARVLFDFFLFVGVVYAIVAVHKWYNPHKRGFFCDDESLKYPFHENTIGIWEMIAVILIVPAIIIIVLEFIKQLKFVAKNNYNLVQRLKNCYKHLGYYFFGFAMIWLATDIAKYGVGRLRPNFFAVCSPQMPDGTTCADPINFGRYITEYTCVGPHATAKLVAEIKRSFPSGHTSLIFYAAVYMCLYLQTTLSKNFSKLFKHFVQLGFMMTALYVALTRISDYWHHWSDVLSGSLLGIFFAVFTAVVVADLFKCRTNSLLEKSYDSESCDTLATLESGYSEMTQITKNLQRQIPTFIVEKMPLSSGSDD